MEEDSEEANLFMAHTDMLGIPNNVWLIDSGWSNHIIGNKELFRNLDKSKKLKVKLGDDKEIQVKGDGIVAISTSSSGVKLIHKVQYAPNLAYNLLSAG